MREDTEHFWKPECHLRFWSINKSLLVLFFDLFHLFWSCLKLALNDLFCFLQSFDAEWDFWKEDLWIPHSGAHLVIVSLGSIEAWTVSWCDLKGLFCQSVITIGRCRNCCQYLLVGYCAMLLGIACFIWWQLRTLLLFYLFDFNSFLSQEFWLVTTVRKLSLWSI